MMNSMLNNNNNDQRSHSTNYLYSSYSEQNSQRSSSSPSLATRTRTYSLSHHRFNPTTMAITATTSFSEEQTTTTAQETSSIDLENTYFCPEGEEENEQEEEETTRLDDALSLTTITSAIETAVTTTQHDASIYSDMVIFQSDTEETSDTTNNPNQYGSTYDINQFDQSNADDKQIIIPIDLNLTPSDPDFIGIVHAKKYSVIKETKQFLSDYDNDNMNNNNNNNNNNNMIRSSADIVSLNNPMMSSVIQHSATGDEEEQDQRIYNHCIRVQQIDQSMIMMNNEQKTTTTTGGEDDEDDQFVSTRQFDNGQLDGSFSDDGDSQSSDDLRYSSDVARNSCGSDDLNNTSSTLRQEAISLTRVRCKRRKTWIRGASSPTRSASATKITNNTYLQRHRLQTNLIQSFSSIDQVDGTDAQRNKSVNSTILSPMNQIKQVQTHEINAAEAMLYPNDLHVIEDNANDSNNNNKKKKKNGETPSYDFIPTNNVNNDHPIKINESPLSHSMKTATTHDKDAAAVTTTSTNDFFLIHHQKSSSSTTTLNSVKQLLNESVDSNIEIIQMDEQECILEIVDGVLTIVPKDKSTSSSGADVEGEQHDDYVTRKHKQRSSSVASSVSTPSLSEHEHDEISSSSSSKKHQQQPFILTRDFSPKPISTSSSSSKQPLEESVDLLDLFSTPLPSSITTNLNQNSTSNKTKNLLEDSLSSVSSSSHDDGSNSDRDLSPKKRPSLPRSSSPKPTEIQTKKPFTSKDELPVSSPSVPTENQTRTNKSVLLNQLLKTVKKSSSDDEDEQKIPEKNFLLPKTEPPPAAKPIDKTRINEFANLLSASVHLAPPSTQTGLKKQTKIISTRPPPSPTRSDDQSFTSVPSASSDRDDRESYHTVKSNNSELDQQQQLKKHIDARYNEKLDDRTSIQINTANIKALFEQKISDTNRALSASSEQLSHLSEIRQQNNHTHKKVPISYGSLKRSVPQQQQSRRATQQDIPAMNKYSEHIAGTKDVVIEDKQPEHTNTHQTNGYSRRHNSEQIIRPNTVSTSPISISNGYYSESLIAKEIRETKEKEEELRQQRKKCGLTENSAEILPGVVQTSPPAQPAKSSSFLSNLDFFTSKATPEQPSSRRSTVCTPQNVVYDTSNDELKQIKNVVSQELNRFTENGIPLLRTNSTNTLLHRSSSTQNILSSTNVVQREIETIRLREAELREMGRIIHTSDELSDPRKYTEQLSPPSQHGTLPKSQSVNMLATVKTRRDSENHPRTNGPMIATSNGFLKPKSGGSVSTTRGKFPSPSTTAPIISASAKTIDYSKLSTTDRLEQEKRECQEREQELRKQRNSISAATSSSNTTINGDSGNVSENEHEEDQERYFDKIERLKRSENEKAQAPMVRPVKKKDLSQKWEQMVANNTGTGPNLDFV